MQKCRLPEIGFTIYLKKGDVNGKLLQEEYAGVLKNVILA
jgi:hypothetical protein